MRDGETVSNHAWTSADLCAFHFHQWTLFHVFFGSKSQQRELIKNARSTKVKPGSRAFLDSVYEEHDAGRPTPYFASPLDSYVHVRLTYHGCERLSGAGLALYVEVLYCHGTTWSTSCM